MVASLSQAEQQRTLLRKKNLSIKQSFAANLVMNLNFQNLIRFQRLSKCEVSYIVSLNSTEEINLVSTSFTVFFSPAVCYFLSYQSILSVKYYFNLNLQVFLQIVFTKYLFYKCLSKSQFVHCQSPLQNFQTCHFFPQSKDEPEIFSVHSLGANPQQAWAGCLCFLFTNCITGCLHRFQGFSVKLRVLSFCAPPRPRPLLGQCMIFFLALVP